MKRLLFTASAHRRRVGAQAASEPLSGPSVPEVGQEAILVARELPAGLQALAWHEETRTLLAVLDEGADEAPFREALLEVEGVEGFDYEWNQVPDGWFTAELLLPYGPPDWMTSETASLERDHQLAIDLARSPLPPE